MKKIALLLFVTLMSGCVQYSLVPAGPQTVKGLSFQSQTDWNKSPFNLGSNTEVWTQDGQLLNEIIFVGGVETGDSIFRASNRELPMPTYDATMLPNEITELVETSLKNYYGGQVVINSTNLRPQQVGDLTGFRFGLSFFTLEGLLKKGEVLALPQNDSLNLVIFMAAEIHYYDKSLTEIDQLFDSISI